MGDMPRLHPKLRQIIQETQIGSRELKVMWNLFQRYDTKRAGTITQEDFHRMIRDEELLYFFGMCLFDLVGCTNYNAIGFSDFCYAIVIFSLFGQEELLRFSFNCFDPERNGFIDLTDYELMSKVLHAQNSHSHGVTGEGANVQSALSQMNQWVQTDKRIDFTEFVESNKLWPWMLKPTQKFQRVVRELTFGNLWWEQRLKKLQADREWRAGVQRDVQSHRARWEAERERRAHFRLIRRRMGYFSFYVCPILRVFFMCSCWDESRSRNDVRREAIAQRLKEKHYNDLTQKALGSNYSKIIEVKEKQRTNSSQKLTDEERAAKRAKDQKKRLEEKQSDRDERRKHRQKQQRHR